jgi:hypothetical protein
MEGTNTSPNATGIEQEECYCHGMASQGKSVFQRGWFKKSSWYTIAANFYQW